MILQIRPNSSSIVAKLRANNPILLERNGDALPGNMDNNRCLVHNTFAFFQFGYNGEKLEIVSHAKLYVKDVLLGIHFLYCAYFLMI
jgi:hypothetical protein